MFPVTMSCNINVVASEIYILIYPTDGSIPGIFVTFAFADTLILRLIVSSGCGGMCVCFL